MEDDGDFGLSAAEVQDFLAAGGNQMIDLIAKFDTNMDGELDADEMASLNAYLEEEADKMPPRVNKLSQEGLGGHMMMTMFRKGRLQMKSERAEKKETPDQKLVRRCARADKRLLRSGTELSLLSRMTNELTRCWHRLQNNNVMSKQP